MHAAPANGTHEFVSVSSLFQFGGGGGKVKRVKGVKGVKKGADQI